MVSLIFFNTYSFYLCSYIIFMILQHKEPGPSKNSTPPKSPKLSKLINCFIIQFKTN